MLNLKTGFAFITLKQMQFESVILIKNETLPYSEVRAEFGCAFSLTHAHFFFFNISDLYGSVASFKFYKT